MIPLKCQSVTECGGIKHSKSFPVLLQPVHVSDDVIAFFGMCLDKGAMDSSGCLIPVLFMYRNEGLPHGIGSFATCDIDELIIANALPNKDFGKSVIEVPNLVVFGLLINIGHRECPSYNGKEFTELKETHNFSFPPCPVDFREFLRDQGQGLHLPYILPC